MRFLRTNTAARITVGPFFDKTDGVTPEVALTVTSCKLTFMCDVANVPTLILDTNPTASGGANDMVHVTGDDAGFYDLELAAADVNYLGRAMIALTDAATHCPVFHEFMILPAMIYDSLVLGTDVLDASVTQLLGTAWVTPTVAGTPDVNALQIAGSAPAATNLKNHALRAVPVTFQTSGGTTTAAALVNVDGAAASATNDVYNGRILVFSAPSGLKDQVCQITGYVGATKIATITAVTTAPDVSAAAVMV